MKKDIGIDKKRKMELSVSSDVNNMSPLTTEKPGQKSEQDKKEMNMKSITTRMADYSQWYLDIIAHADLAARDAFDWQSKLLKDALIKF